MAREKKQNQGLQKLTLIRKKTEEKIKYLLGLEYISKDEVNALLNKEEKAQFNITIKTLLSELKGGEKSNFLEKISDALPEDVRSQLYENNHYAITGAISQLIHSYGIMPTKNEIAEATGLSRTTIYKHLKGFAEHPIYAEQMDQFKIMSRKILAGVMKQAEKGDNKAARLFFEVMGNLNNSHGKGTQINNQNNFIQINGTVLSQDTIAKLLPEQLTQIENLINSIPVNQYPTTIKNQENGSK